MESGLNEAGILLLIFAIIMYTILYFKIHKK